MRILKKMKSLLIIGQLDPEIERRIDLDNMKFCHMLSAFVVVCEGILIVLYWCFGNADSDSYTFRISCYTVYFALSVIWLFLSKYAINNIISHNMIMIIGLSYSAMAVLWSILISAIDYSNGKQVFVFLTTIVFIAGFGLMKPIVSTLFFSANFAVFYLILIFASGAEHTLPLNYIFLWLAIIITSAARYHTKLSDTMAQVASEELNKILEIMSLYDELTGVKNRRSLSLDVPSFVNKCMFLMLIDIDGYKNINDTHGHDYGDLALKEFAKVLQNYFYTQSVYRYGGDEFVVVACDCKREILLEKIRNCQKDMSAIRLENANPGLTFSGGYLFGKIDDEKEFEAMLKSVDNALYISKRNGKNQMTCADLRD